VLAGRTIAPVVGNETIPVVAIESAVVAPLLPTFNAIESVAPTPDVDCNVRDDPVPVPPYTDGAVIDVTLGVAE
jgi:hypothetical protein